TIFVTKMPKSIKLLLLILAHFIFVGHSVVAHHHHNPSYVQQEHPHHQYNSGDLHPEGNLIEVAYSGLAHTGVHAVHSPIDHNYQVNFKKIQDLDPVFIFTKYDWEAEKDISFNNPPSFFESHGNHYLNYSSKHYLRGPPHFIV
ncbi:MAG: hypothetical protein L0G39_20370, partial [Chryseobacterium sp.]|nr:hypothetical protein [Chryseobacterium sp.]